MEEELKAYYSEAKIPQKPQIRRPDGEIKLILGKDSSNVNKQTDPKESKTRKNLFVLPQLDVSTFTGRDEELSRLEELLLNRQGTKVCSIAGLAGVGGIGKSALACHFATIHKDDFSDGVIGLRVDGKDLDAIACEFARRCGEEIDSEDERDAATIMQEVFAHRRMLLIFDNAEDANIRALRPGGERCAVIIWLIRLGRTPYSTVYWHYKQWRDAGAIVALMHLLHGQVREQVKKKPSGQHCCSLMPKGEKYLQRQYRVQGLLFLQIHQWQAVVSHRYEWLYV